MGQWCTEPGDQYTFFYGKGNQYHELGTGLFSYIRNKKRLKLGGGQAYDRSSD
jgi:hypothetical protein